jgi:hypothetical protein
MAALTRPGQHHSTTVVAAIGLAIVAIAKLEVLCRRDLSATPGHDCASSPGRAATPSF